jgi:hypothetical protein
MACLFVIVLVELLEKAYVHEHKNNDAYLKISVQFIYWDVSSKMQLVKLTAPM